MQTQTLIQKQEARQTQTEGRGLYDVGKPMAGVPTKACEVLRDWQGHVPAAFKTAVSSWGTQSQCHVLTANPDAPQPCQCTTPIVEVPTISQVPRHVNVTRASIRVRETPKPVCITQDVVRYKNMTKKIQKIVTVEDLQKCQKTVEVPKYVSNVTPISRRISKPVFKEKQVRFDVKVPKVKVQEKPVKVKLKSDEVVYKETAQAVTTRVEVPEMKKCRKEVHTTKFEEVVEEVHVEAAQTIGDADIPKEVVVEVVKVKLKEVKVPVDVYQDTIKYKPVKQKVTRKVEVPKLVVKQRQVEVPQYKTVVKEVPVVEVRQRTVEVIKEVPTIVDVRELVDLIEERVVVNTTLETQAVTLTTQVPDHTSEVVEVKQSVVNVLAVQKNEVLEAVEKTTTTKEVVQVEEEIEEVEKYVNVYVDRQEIVQIPKTVIQEVIKTVPIVITREEIVKVPIYETITIVTEEAVNQIEEIEVEVHSEQIVLNQTVCPKNLTVETVIGVEDNKSSGEVTIVNPKPFALSDTCTQFTETKVCDSHSVEEVQKALSQEYIVQDSVVEEIVQNVEVLMPNVETNEIEAPLWNVEEEIVEVRSTRVQHEIVEKEIEYEVDKYTVTTEEEEVVFVSEVAVPNYVDEPVTIQREVPVFEQTKRNVVLQMPKLQLNVQESPRTICDDEIVEIPKVEQIKRTVYLQNASAKNASLPSNPKVTFVEREVERTVEVPVPTYRPREVEVDVVEVVEEVQEVEVETIVEEIVEVPKIIEVVQIVEVPTIEYNDTIVEKIVYVQAPQKRQEPVKKYKDVPVTLKNTNVAVHKKTESVPVKTQGLVTTLENVDVEQVFTYKTLRVTPKTEEVRVPKKVKVKKKVEKLVPVIVERVVTVPVEVVRTIIQEKVVPVYSETVIQKMVNVTTPKVVEQKVQKVLKQQVVKPKHSWIEKRVDVVMETANVVEVLKEVPLRRQDPKLIYKDVPVVVPCDVNIASELRCNCASQAQPCSCD